MGSSQRKTEIEASKKRFNPQKKTTGRKYGEVQSRSRTLLVDLSYGECIPIGIISVTNTTSALISKILNDDWADTVGTALVNE